MVHYIFWPFSRGAPASQPAGGGQGGGGEGGFPKAPSQPAAARRSSTVSRRGLDRNNLFRLHPFLFRHALRFHRHHKPPIDLFASPQNSKCRRFVARFPTGHPQQTFMNSLTADLRSLRWAYACPPWTVIHPFLTRLRQFPQLRVWLVIPLWEGAPWFSLLIRLFEPQSRPLRLRRCRHMFLNCCSEPLSAPRCHGVYSR